MPASAGRPVGRTSKHTPEREQAVLNALRLGNTRRAAAAYAEVDSATLYRWMEDAAFRAAIEKAEADAEARFVGQVAKAASDGTWQAAAWWLERRRHNDYARRDKVEMTVDIRAMAQAVADAQGLDTDEVLAEAERIMAGTL